MAPERRVARQHIRDAQNHSTQEDQRATLEQHWHSRCRFRYLESTAHASLLGHISSSVVWQGLRPRVCTEKYLLGGLRASTTVPFRRPATHLYVHGGTLFRNAILDQVVSRIFPEFGSWH